MTIHIIDLENGLMHIVNLVTEICESLPLIVLSDITEYAEEIEDISDDYLTVEYDEDLTDDSDSYLDDRDSDLLEAYAR